MLVSSGFSEKTGGWRRYLHSERRRDAYMRWISARWRAVDVIRFEDALSVG